MNKTIITAAVALLGMATLYSCGDDREVLTGQGSITLATSVSSDVNVVSRAASEAELGDNCLIWISGKNGLVREYQGVSNIPVGAIPLTAGHYVAEAWTGDSVSASFDDRWFKAREEFDVTPGASTRVELVCKIANSVVSVKYDEAVDQVLSDFVMTVGHTRGNLTFEGRDERKGYFMMPSADKNLTWTLQGKQSDGSIYTRTGVIPNAKPTTEYVLNVKFNGSTPDVGGAYLTIVVDEHEVEVADNVVIALAPQIEGYDFNIDNPVYGEAGAIGRKSLYLTASSALTAVELDNKNLAEMIGLDGNDVELFGMSEAVGTALENAGINFNYVYDAEADVSNMKINFEPSFTDRLADGEHVYRVRATDANGKTSTGTFTIVVSSASVVASPANPADIYTTSAVLTGSILKSGVTKAGFNYRPRTAARAEAGWTYAEAVISGFTFSATLTGLTPGTVYEYVAVTDDFESTDVRTFETEAAAQLPNAGFEDWDTSGKFYLPYNTTAAFWDTGNKGSSTMSKNVTFPSTEYTHSGRYSAKLESQFVGVGALGKFAAGNIFVGKYVATKGTNGVLGWGRPFTSRPKALKGYVKYTPSAIEWTNGKLPSVAKGDPDQGIIYVALVDGTLGEFEGASEFPVYVDTRDTNTFFNKDAANIIAYGEAVFTDATAGDGMVEFNIPIDYKRSDKPCYIIITCSASRYGDYFVGGKSVMYLDDFELVY